MSDNQNPYDVFIIGGGINGAGIAREAAKRGYTVCLADKGDFGGATSSASTKLIHGGLRYLEHYEFRLVREALKERELLWSMAPHIIYPLRFVLPHHPGLRPKWLLRLGLFIYDHLGGRKLLAPATTLDLVREPEGRPLKPEFKSAFEYSDCWVMDSRLVILNLRDAQTSGANLLPRSEVKSARFQNGVWEIQLDGKTIFARSIVNAAGPWVDHVLRSVFGLNNAQNVRLVRGSHIVVPRKFDHDKAYFFQNSDERIMFAIPYENDFTLIGTTDAEQKNLAKPVAISKEETDYLCEMASSYFEEPVTPGDVVWTYSGVRPLYDDGASKAQEATRDYVVRTEKELGQGTLFNIFGGKITTFRQLANTVLRSVSSKIGEPTLPKHELNCFVGGDFECTKFEELRAALVSDYSFLPKDLAIRLARSYGTEAWVMLENCKQLKDMGKHFGNGLYEREVRFLIEFEWAKTAEDILFRRTRLGIRYSDDQVTTLDSFMTRNAKNAA